MAHRKSGFTLIEMLVVIGLISVLAMGISMLNMKDASQAIYSAQRSMMTAFYEARTTALTRQTDVKVIIYKGSDISRKLRQVGVIYKVKGEDGLDLGWVALNDGFRMPEGVFFVPSASNFSSFVKTSGQTSPSEIFKSTFNNGYTGAYEIVGVPQPPTHRYKRRKWRLVLLSVLVRRAFIKSRGFGDACNGAFGRGRLLCNRQSL